MNEDRERKYGPDDWLAKEIKRENGTSFWEFDFGRDESNEQKEEREFATEKYYKDLKKQNKTEFLSKKEEASISRWLIFDFILALGLAALNMYLGNGAYWPTTVLLLMLCPGMFVWMFMFKRFMPSWYLALGALIAVILELLTVFNIDYAVFFY